METEKTNLNLRQSSEENKIIFKRKRSSHKRAITDAIYNEELTLVFMFNIIDKEKRIKLF